MIYTLRQSRCRFTECIALLILEAELKGYEMALAEGMDRKTERDPTTDHMKGSLHEIGLAQDIDLYKDGKYVCGEGVKCKDPARHVPFDKGHEKLGEWWEQLGKSKGYPLRSGIKFDDANHYSWEDMGKK